MDTYKNAPYARRSITKPPTNLSQFRNSASRAIMLKKTHGGESVDAGIGHHDYDVVET